MDSEKKEMIRASNLTCKEQGRTQEKIRGLYENLGWAESIKKDKESSETKLTRDRRMKNWDYNSLLAEKNSKENILFESKRKLQHMNLDIELKSSQLKKLQASESQSLETKNYLQSRLSELKSLELELRKRNIELKGDISAQNLIKSNIINKIDTNKIISV